jgi:hypothetical protein
LLRSAARPPVSHEAPARLSSARTLRSSTRRAAHLLVYDPPRRSGARNKRPSLRRARGASGRGVSSAAAHEAARRRRLLLRRVAGGRRRRLHRGTQHGAQQLPIDRLRWTLTRVGALAGVNVVPAARRDGSAGAPLPRRAHFAPVLRLCRSRLCSLASAGRSRAACSASACPSLRPQPPQRARRARGS